MKKMITCGRRWAPQTEKGVHAAVHNAAANLVTSLVHQRTRHQATSSLQYSQLKCISDLFLFIFMQNKLNMIELKQLKSFGLVILCCISLTAPYEFHQCAAYLS